MDDTFKLIDQLAANPDKRYATAHWPTVEKIIAAVSARHITMPDAEVTVSVYFKGDERRPIYSVSIAA